MTIAIGFSHQTVSIYELSPGIYQVNGERYNSLRYAIEKAGSHFIFIPHQRL